MRWVLCSPWWLLYNMAIFSMVALGDDILYEWHVKINDEIKPISQNQSVITINDEFPGPLINATTNDNVHVNVYNDMDEPLLITWNGIQQRLNSWQDGVSGTNCPIQPGKNWTYVFRMKDQIGSFFYFPSINYQRAAGGFGPIRINNRVVIGVPFPKPQQELDLLIGDWYRQTYKDVRRTGGVGYSPDFILMNGKGSFLDSSAKTYESFSVSTGKTYRFRISNVGNLWSINFRIQSHKMLLVESEGSYTNQIILESLDIHVGQSYSVLIFANQTLADYYIVATPKWIETGAFAAVGLLHYENSTTPANGPIPDGPDPFNVSFSINQAKSITLNLTTGGARPNPQGAFNVSNVTLSQTFVLHGSSGLLNSKGSSPRFTINNVTYTTPSTPLKLADQFLNGSGVYVLDTFPVNSSLSIPTNGTFVVSGIHKGWLEIVIHNDFVDKVDSWHLNGFAFFVVGYGLGEWTPEGRNTYNTHDPIVRSTIQVYPEGWSAVYVYLDNPGMWNLRSQNLQHWYLGQELYIRVYDPDLNPTKERQPPNNLLFCGLVQAPPPPPSSIPPPPPPSSIPPPTPIPVPTPTLPTPASGCIL